MTLKSREYTNYLWGNIYKEVCTNTPPYPGPPIKTGKNVSQYHFTTL